MFGWWNSKFETLVSWVVLIVVVLWLIFAGAIKPVLFPSATHNQSGGNFYEIKVGFGGCARLPLK